VTGRCGAGAGLRAVIAKHGLFCALYSDRGSHFWVTVVGSTSVDLSLLSIKYAGTVSFTTTVTSGNGNPSNILAYAPSVTL
jgi:hypothetical protein